MTIGSLIIILSTNLLDMIGCVPLALKWHFQNKVITTGIYELNIQYISIPLDRIE